jgi:hypothetical protein
MKTQIVLTGAELADLIGGVMEYNGRQALSVNFSGVEGEPLSVGSVVIDCEAPGLAVRTKPDGAEAGDVSQIAALLYRESMDRVDPKATVKP